MNIMLTSAGRRSYLVGYFKRAVGEDGVVIAANSVECPAFHVADRYVVTPIIYSDEYIPFLVEYCKEYDVDLLIPLFDIDIPVLARNKKLLEEAGAYVLVPEPDVADACNDKWLTFKWLAENGIGCPHTALGYNAAVEKFVAGEFEFPVVVKPRWGMASIGTYVAHTSEELEVLCKMVERDIASSYLKYESNGAKGSNVIVQEMLPGVEHGLDIMCDLEGNYVATSVKRKEAMRSGETDSATVVDREDLRKLGETLAAVFPHPGNMDVDVFVYGDKLYVLELNARFGGGYPFSHAAGVDLPSALVDWRAGKEVDPSRLKAAPNTYSYKEIVIVTP